MIANIHIEGSGILLTTFMWILMMTVMMAPVVFPWIVNFAEFTRDIESGAFRYGWMALFCSGYLVLWSAFSLVGALLQLSLRSWGLLGASAALSTPLAGFILIGAGTYQLTPLKNACLRHCRNPMGYFLSRWRDGPTGAFRMGISHGFYCVGCCWALMLTVFGLGLMNLMWMVALMLLISVETFAPRGEQFGKIAGLALVVWGLFLLGGRQIISIIG